MRFVYHPDLIEKAVFLVTRADPGGECALHEQIDRLYAISDVETRNAAFQTAYADFFTRENVAAGMESLVSSLMKDGSVDRCAVVPAAGRKGQRLDLLSRSEGGRTEHTLFLQVKPESILDPTPLLPWLRRELLMAADMLDPAFGYKADDVTGTPWERTTRQDRYMVLWRIYVEGRLHRTGHSDQRETSALRVAFEKLFSHQGVRPSEGAFERVLGADSLTHAQLLSWALKPATLIAPHQKRPWDTPRPGGLCPLCGFPTYDWFGFEEDVGGKAEAAIRTAYGAWSRDQGACRQCAETYTCRVATGMSAGPSEGVEDGSKEQNCAVA